MLIPHARVALDGVLSLQTTAACADFDSDAQVNIVREG